MKKKVYFVIGLCFAVFIGVISYWTVLPRTGTLEFPGEGVYAGQLRGQTFHGQGTWITNFGVTYTGEFKNGSFHGIGTLTFANGSSYTGGFKGGRMHGHGVMTFSDGHTHEGYWDADQFLGDHHDCDHDH